MANKKLIEKIRQFGNLTPYLSKVAPRGTDNAYQKRYIEASGPTEKGLVLTEYLEQWPDEFNKSGWVKTALADVPHMRGSPSAPDRDPASSIRGERDSTVAARRTELRNMLRSNKRQPSAKDVCTRWDGCSIKPPEEWQEKGFVTWMKAYSDRTFKPNVKKLVSTDIRRVLERRS